MQPPIGLPLMLFCGTKRVERAGLGLGLDEVAGAVLTIGDSSSRLLKEATAEFSWALVMGAGDILRRWRKSLKWREGAFL